MDLLDNPVWHALTGPQQTVAQARPGAARYEPDVALFSGMPDEPKETSWDDLREIVGPGEMAVLFGRPARVPDGWNELFALPTAQMVATAVDAAPCQQAEPLGEDDVHEMLALVDRTHPGPFELRTNQLGNYIGIRDESGALVAMAGERMHPPGYREISAVCTDDRFRGRGYASALVRDLCGRIAGRGETAMLHVVKTNVSAIRVYEAIGFTTRLELDVIGLRAPH